jgi:hypothetical protein
MDANRNARKIRSAAERPQSGENERRKSDTEAAEAHPDLTQPKHSKGRPAPRRGRASNAGNDGP